jgi:hypothetical protein
MGGREGGRESDREEALQTSSCRGNCGLGAAGGLGVLGGE